MKKRQIELSRRLVYAFVVTVTAVAGCGSSKGGAPTGAGGTTGTGGTTGSGGTTGTAGTAGGESQSVLERNKHPSRDGAFVQPTLTTTAAATMAADAGFTASFTGNMWASPLYLQNGPNGKGVYFAVTTGNDVFALDETTGAQVWTHNIGSSPTSNAPAGTTNCGNIHPLGILSTPVIDANARTIYVAGAIGTTSITSHEVHALSVDDGTEKSGWPINNSTATSGSITFDTVHENQRSALSLVNGVLYVAYGGHIGDCGAYHGWVIGITTSNPTMRGAWATGGQGEGIWQAGGLASDGTSVFTPTGNRTGGSGAHQDSEEVVRITGLGTRADAFYPSRWSTMDGQDADMSANSPVYITSPGPYVVQISKDGHLYLLDPANLGGQDGFKVDFTVASGAMAIHTAPAAYRTAMGTHVVFSTDSGAQCPSGGGKSVVSVLIPAGNPPAPSVAWCVAQSGPVTAPIATTTDGQANAIVWFMNNGKLMGVDGDTGATVFGGGSSTCSGVQQWTSPIAANGHIVVGGNGHLCSWSPQ